MSGATPGVGAGGTRASPTFLPDDRSTVVLHVVRHCDVENPHGLIYGRLGGFGLSKLGQIQAEQVAAYLSDRSVSTIFSSPRLRAIQTARAIAKHHPEAPLRRSRFLDEVRSEYQGRLHSEVPAGVNMFDNPIAATDESIADVYRRMVRFVETVRERYHRGELPEGDVVCVSHAAPIGILRAGLEGFPLLDSSLKGDRDPQKGSVTTLTFQPCEALPKIEYRPIAIQKL